MRLRKKFSIARLNRKQKKPETPIPAGVSSKTKKKCDRTFTSVQSHVSIAKWSFLFYGCDKLSSCHHRKLRMSEVLAIAGNNDVGLGTESGVILHSIFKVLELRGQRVIYGALVSNSNASELSEVRQQVAHALRAVLVKEEGSRGECHRRNDKLHLTVVGHREETDGIVAEGLTAL